MNSKYAMNTLKREHAKEIDKLNKELEIAYLALSLNTESELDFYFALDFAKELHKAITVKKLTERCKHDKCKTGRSNKTC